MLPERCRKCARNKNHGAHTSCRICADTEFDETIVCELNRSVQEGSDEFECHAFVPTLEVIGSKKEATADGRKPAQGNLLAEQLAVIKLMNSDKIQHQKACALQQLERDPEAIIVNLKLHYVWNVKGRRNIFAKSEESFSRLFCDAFAKAAIPSVLRAQLLWLGPDHVHVYCEADGERSLENMLIDIKRYLEQDALNHVPQIAEVLGPSQSLWDDDYYVESVG